MKAKKAQVILEYLIVLTAIVVAIIGATVGFRNGLERNLNINSQIAQGIINGREAPTRIRQEPYYVNAQGRVDHRWHANIDAYGGLQFEANYYFHEGPSDTSHLPAKEKILDRDDSYQAQPSPGVGYWR